MGRGESKEKGQERGERAVEIWSVPGNPPSAGRVESQQIYLTCRQILPRNDIDPFSLIRGPEVTDFPSSGKVVFGTYHRRKSARSLTLPIPNVASPGAPHGERPLLAGRGWSDCDASSPQNDSYLEVSLLHAAGAFNAAAL
jgi:hypothetical protein